MTAGRILLLTGAGLLAYNLLAKGSALQTLQFWPYKVRKITFDGATPVITMGLLIQNSSNQEMIVRSIVGNLSANGTIIGNVTSFDTVRVLANNQTELVLNVRLSAISLVNDVVRAFQFNNFSQELRLQGYANVDNFQLPIDVKYNIGL